MSKVDKSIEDNLRAKGWMKLLPTDEYPTGQSHRFRYLAKVDFGDPFIVIIQGGELRSVFSGLFWQERYREVDWDTPDCQCRNCATIEAIDELERSGKLAASFVRDFENNFTEAPVDISGLELVQEENGFRKISFYYRIDESEKELQ